MATGYYLLDRGRIRCNRVDPAVRQHPGPVVNTYSGGADVAKRTCKIDGCESPARCKGWCQAHYMRWRRHGDPLGAAQPAPVANRFWTKVDKTGDCWLWLGSKNPQGYGKFKMNRRDWSAHRVAVLLDGRDPGGHVVRHTCDNPPCVNPAHLVLGTQSENIRDAVRRGRHRAEPPGLKGEKHPQSKLTRADAVAIASDDRINRVVAAEFGVSVSTVQHIKTGRKWSHATGRQPK